MSPLSIKSLPAQHRFVMNQYGYAEGMANERARLCGTMQKVSSTEAALSFQVNFVNM